MSRFGKEKRKSADDVETVDSNYANARCVNVDFFTLISLISDSKLLLVCIPGLVFLNDPSSFLTIILPETSTIVIVWYFPTFNSDKLHFWVVEC